MKGALKRFRKKQARRNPSDPMSFYAESLQRVVNAGGNGRSLKDHPRPLVIRLKPNEVYAVRRPDDDRYYRTVMIKKTALTGNFQILVSNPVMGTIPDGIQEVPQEQVFKQMRDMNAQMTTGSDFSAFPHTGATGPSLGGHGQGMVSQHHQNLQGRNWS